MVSPLPNMPFHSIHQGLEGVLKEIERFHPFSFGLEGAQPFLYRQYWNKWNQFMVARELSAPQVLEELEDLFISYYENAAL